jgi:hypothetical protein
MLEDSNLSKLSCL